MDGLTVGCGNVRHEVSEGGTLSFGRSVLCDVRIGADPPDLSISRHAGEVRCERGRAWLANTSEHRPLEVVDRSRWPAVLSPGSQVPIDSPWLLVIVTGALLRHALTIEHAGFEGRAVSADAGDDATIQVALTMRERRAVVALCEGYLLPWPRYRPLPATYEEAAARSGLEASQVRKRVERLRDRVADHVGVEFGGGDHRAAVCRYALTHHLVTVDDLVLLDAPEPPSGSTGTAGQS